MITCQGRLPKALARTLSDRGYRRLTPVQRAVLRVGAADTDLIVSARTGSGKTIAYGLAVARRLFEAAAAGAGSGPRALVVTPTRELALQVRDELAWLLAGTGVRLGCCIGGADLRAERELLAAGLDLLVGTPGRLCDHLRQGALATASIGCVVLDEADDMLEPGFRDDIEALLGSLPAARQTLMFSATIGPEAEALARQFQRDPVRIDLGNGDSAGGIALQAVAVAPGDREAAIVNLLLLHDARATIVFCSRREAVRHLAHRLAARGFVVTALSGALSQRHRSAALAAMRQGRARVCVATDVAARGIDLPGLDLVLHADLPGSSKLLLHRSGRTGRAGRSGRAVLVLTRQEQRRARLLAARAGLSIEWVPPPDRATVLARDLERMLGDPALAAPPGDADRPLIATLLAAHGAERVAAAYARLWSASRPVPDDLTRAHPKRSKGRGPWSGNDRDLAG